MSNPTVQSVGNRRSVWGEGPLWWEDRLLYVDIEDHKLIRLDPSTGREEEVFDVGERIGTVVPRKRGGFLYAGDSGMNVFDPDSGEKTNVADPEAEKRPDNRFNDGKCDPRGRFWAGTISTVKKTGDANLYMLDENRGLHKRLTGLTNSNGICWSGDGTTLFHIDTPTKRVRAFPFSLDDGALGEPRTVVNTEELEIEGSPDGMAIDTEDRLWIAICHAGRVIGLDSSNGECFADIALPCVETTACAFGGPELKRLFVTTGQKPGVSEPEAGKIFVVDGLQARGVPAIPFAG